MARVVKLGRFVNTAPSRVMVVAVARGLRASAVAELEGAINRADMLQSVGWQAEVDYCRSYCKESYATNYPHSTRSKKIDVV